MTALTFDDRTGQFRNARGQFVSPASVRAVVDDIADGASARMAAASERMLAGDLLLAEWQSFLMQQSKLAIVGSGTIATGGAARMSFSDYGYLGRLIRDEYDRIRTFAEQVSTGEQPLNGRLTARARMYGQQARIVYEKVKARDAASRGMAEERNVLRAGESCSQCKAESAQGWVPLGTLVPCGQRICLSNCKCSIARRSRLEAAA